MGVGSQSKKFVFVPVKGNSSDAPSQKFIRAHAVREALRQKAAGTKLSAPHRVVPYQTGRFRISTSPPKTEAKTKSERELQSDGSLSPVPDNAGELVVARRDSMQYYAQSVEPVLPMILSPGRLDPFDSLPIKFGSQQQMLLSYYDTSFTQNDLAFNADRKMISIASSDPAWLHATFALVALSHGLSTGIADGVSLECLFNRGQALHIIKQRLHDPATDVAESTIGTIASLANIELTIGSLLTCTAHLKGLEQLLRLRGWNGARDIPKQASFLRKLVAWSDLAYAGVTLSRPHFLPIESFSQSSLHPDKVQRDEYTSVPVLQLDMTDLLDNVRCLSQLLDQGHLDYNERAYFQSTIYSTQYQLLALNSKNAFDEVANTHTSLFYQSSTRRSLCMYINMVLRKLPHRAIMHYIMAKHVKSDLEKSGNYLILTWAPNLELLLWILFMGAAATMGQAERSFFVRNLVLVGIELQLSSLDEFIETLELTAWSKTFCFPQSTSLWKEISTSSLVQQQLPDQLTYEVVCG